MGRAGITQLDVENAAIQLQGRGKNPTVDAIRELLGTGSKSTIIQHLKAWKSRHDEAQGKLPHELLALVTGLWQRLNTQAEQRVIEIENASAEQLQELNQTLQQTQQANAELKLKSHQLEQILVEERQAKIELDKQLQFEKLEYEKLHEKNKANTLQLESQKVENARLHQLAVNIQANLEHYQNAMQQARAEQSLVMEKQQTQFQQTLAELHRDLESYRNHFNELEQRLNQKNHAFQKLEEQHDSLRFNYDAQMKNLEAITHELIVIKERYEQQLYQLKIHQNELNDKKLLITEFEKQVAIFLDQQNRMQHDLSQANQKVELLQHEKLFLVQEKAKMEGYCKLLEKNIDSRIINSDI